MTTGDWIQLALLAVALIGGVWAIVSMGMKNSINEQHIKDLEKENNRKDTEIEYLKKRIDEKNDAIMKLK